MGLDYPKIWRLPSVPRVTPAPGGASNLNRFRFADEIIKNTYNPLID